MSASTNSSASVSSWMILMRPSRRPLCGLLRMRFFLMPSKTYLILRRREAPSRRTHGAHAAPKTERQNAGLVLTRPVQTDRIAPVPGERGFADLIEDAHPGRRRLGHLDDRARVALIEEIDEGAARGVAHLAEIPAGRQGALADLVVVDRPARPVLHPLMPRGEEIAVEAWGFAALLDQFELHIARIGERDRDLDVVGPAAIAELVHRQLLGVEPRADAAHLDPMAHRLVDVAHDDPDLAHRPEQATHRSLPPYAIALRISRTCSWFCLTTRNCLAISDRT